MPVQPIIPPEWPLVYPLVVGQDWPQADEDAIRRCAQAWTDALAGLVAISGSGGQATQNVHYSVQSIATDEFDRYWKQYTTGDDSAVGQLAQQCQLLAEELLSFAEQTEFTKISIDIQIIILMIQVIFDLFIAPATGGLSMGEAFASIFFTRTVVREILSKLIEAVIMAVLPDLITQGIMVADGHRSGIDWGEAGQSAQLGLIGGLVGMGAGKVLGGLGTGLEKGLGKGLGGLINAGVNGAVTNVVTNAIVSTVDTLENPDAYGYAQQKSGEHPLAAIANGVFTGMLFHGIHEVSQKPTVHFTTDHGTFTGVPTGEKNFTLFPESGPDAGKMHLATLTGDGTLKISKVTGDPVEATPTEMRVTNHGTTVHTTFTDGQPAVTKVEQVSNGGSQFAFTRDGQSWTVPKESVVTYHPDQGPVQVVVPAEGPKQAVYAGSGDRTFTLIGHQEPTSNGGFTYTDAHGNDVSPTTFQAALTKAQEPLPAGTQFTETPPTGSTGTQFTETPSTGSLAGARIESPAPQPVATPPVPDRVAPASPGDVPPAAVPVAPAVPPAVPPEAPRLLVAYPHLDAPEPARLPKGVIEQPSASGEPSYGRVMDGQFVTFIEGKLPAKGQHLVYALFDRNTGEFLKFGRSNQPFTRYGGHGDSDFRLPTQDENGPQALHGVTLRGVEVPGRQVRMRVIATDLSKRDAVYIEGQLRDVWGGVANVEGDYHDGNPARRQRYQEKLGGATDFQSWLDRQVARDPDLAALDREALRGAFRPGEPALPGHEGGRPTQPAAAEPLFTAAGAPNVTGEQRDLGFEPGTGDSSGLVSFAAPNPRGLPPGEFEVGGEHTRHIVVQEALEPANPGVTRPLQMDLAIHPDAPQYARAEEVQLPGVELGDHPPAPDTPQFERLWKAMWRATADTSCEHALVRFEDGRWGIVKGGMEGIYRNPELPIAEVGMHVHPPWREAAGISPQDAELLARTPGQQMAVLVQPGGLVRYFVKDPALVPEPAAEPAWPPAAAPGVPAAAGETAIQALARQSGIVLEPGEDGLTARYTNGLELSPNEQQVLAVFLDRHGKPGGALAEVPPVEPGQALYQQPTVRPVTRTEIAEQYGIPAELQQGFQRIAERYGVVIDLRPSNPEAAAQRLLGAVPKPEDIKAKSLEPRDLLLNPFPHDALALIRGVPPGKPVPLGIPHDAPQREQLAESHAAAFQDLEAFYRKRAGEWSRYHLGEQITELTATGQWRVQQGVVERMVDGQWRRVTGDQDVWDIRRPGGEPLSALEERLIRADLISSGLSVQHGAHMHWENPGAKRAVFQDVVGKHQPGKEPLVRLLPGEEPRLVWADPPDLADPRFTPLDEEVLVASPLVAAPSDISSILNPNRGSILNPNRGSIRNPNRGSILNPNRGDIREGASDGEQ